MNGRMAKKIRREAKKNQLRVVNDFRVFIKELSVKNRIKLAWKVLTKTY